HGGRLRAGRRARLPGLADERVSRRLLQDMELAMLMRPMRSPEPAQQQDPTIRGNDDEVDPAAAKAQPFGPENQHHGCSRLAAKHSKPMAAMTHAASSIASSAATLTENPKQLCFKSSRWGMQLFVPGLPRAS